RVFEPTFFARRLHGMWYFTLPAPVLKSLLSFPPDASFARNSIGSIVWEPTFLASSVPSRRGYSTRIICEQVGLAATIVRPSFTKPRRCFTFCPPPLAALSISPFLPNSLPPPPSY